MNVGSASLPLPAVTDGPRQAPAELKAITALHDSVATRRLPFGRNTIPSASLRLQLPGAMKGMGATGAPVVPLKRLTSLVAALLTYRLPSGPKTMPVGSEMPSDALEINVPS